MRPGQVAGIVGRAGAGVSTTYTDYALAPANWTFLNASYNSGTQRLTENTANSFHIAYVTGGVATPTGVKPVAIIEAKPDTRSIVQLRAGGFVSFNLSTGQSLGGANVRVTSIRPMPDGWFELIIVSTVENSAAQALLCDSSNAINYPGDGVSGLFIRNPRIAAFRNGRIKANPSPSNVAASVSVSPTYKYRGGMLMGDSFAVPSAIDPTVRANNTSVTMLLVPAGTGGRTLAQVNAAFVTDVSTYDPSFAVLQAGINTVASATSDPQAGMQSEIASFVSLCSARNIAPVLTNLPPFQGWTNWSSQRQTWWAAYNAWIPGYAASIGVPMLNVLGILSDDGATLKASFNSGDNLHPNADGYAALGDGLVALLDNVLL